MTEWRIVVYPLFACLLLVWMWGPASELIRVKRIERRLRRELKQQMAKLRESDRVSRGFRVVRGRALWTGDDAA